MLGAPSSPRRERGITLIEALVTIVILAFGLLGLAAFQMRMQAAELESIQRAQALVLMEDMASRIQANRNDAANYLSSSLGTGSNSCTGTAGSAAGDLCEWSELLKGASSSDLKSGNLVSGRGCITQIQAPNSGAGICSPGIYQVEVAWQGVINTTAPASTCASGAYGSDNLRRVVATRVTIGLLDCN